MQPMPWQKIVIDRDKYIHGLCKMMGLIKVPVLHGLEIGLGWGVSAVKFLRAFPDADLLSVDVNPGLEAIRELNARFNGRFSFIQFEVPPRIPPDVKFQWLYIDGGHEFDEVQRDIELYEKFLEPGGVIAFDDYANDPKGKWHYPGVKQAVDAFLAANKKRFSDLIIPITESESGPVCLVKQGG